MDWFKKHLNWTAFLAILLCLMVSTGGSVKTFVETLVFISFARFFAILFLGSVNELIFAAIGLILSVPILIWVLKQKQRTLWWVFIIFVPFGWVIFPRLENRSEVTDIVNGKVITRPRDKND